ncbi:restriction endonuclease subunit S [Bacteroides acidifaciens]|nr:restriction endonuclease subunit S [Bacteroides acidifaciens]
MEKDMQSYRLSDLVKIKNGKDHKMLSNGKYPVLGSGGIMRYVDKFLYDKPSVLLPRKGTLDNIQYCDMPFWTVDTLYYTEVNTNLANPYYLYRYLSLLDLSNLDSGTGVPSMTFDNYYGLKIFLPNIEKQTKIAQILQTLDKKITINRQINQNLEAMAKQLYDYWFVQFDFPNEEGKPYKSSGGEMLWNDKLKRNIPVGWHCGNLFEIAVFTNGLACQKFRPKDDEVPLPVIKIREMHDGISVDTEEVTSNIPESVKVYNGDVLFSWSASLEVMLWAYGLGGLNQHIFKVTSANDFPKSFYYFQLLDYVDVFKKMAEARKTTMGHITQDHLQQSTIAIPDNKDIADKFEELISPIFKQIVKLQEEISNLIKQRDELLPLLMNGQITIE